ncbi:alpha/beta fold hydrolase [Sphingomonas nostoxanthinifaciens]|uniref:alpha/beta fold hydrolase n=1 Tax=Sphingomonas nostoxanthinifaciens TaxID=2872652 RepID=UPI001CC1DAA1|nr:alpha/beta hydrolase [Sphingomonas nostoxanthinifaciens]UAK24480.1 alpha/beta hydrolase [Sphingomonas nostoxanthinifaciens]
MIWTFHHGWGFDADFWAPLIAALGVAGAADDRGYFGPVQRVTLPSGPCIRVGHSLGGLRMLAEPAPHACAMIVINGFDRFTASSGHPGAAPRLLDAMIRRCARDPAATVGDFRARCGESAPIPGEPTARLADDLARLRDIDMRGHVPSVPLLVLHGARDPILSEAQRAAGFGDAAHDRATCAEAGHLLPATHADWCAERIAGFVAGLA